MNNISYARFKQSINSLDRLLKNYEENIDKNEINNDLIKGANKIISRGCNIDESVQISEVESIITIADKLSKLIYRMTLSEHNKADLSFKENLISYKSSEKIRIVFLFQIPSVWASLESVWKIVIKDSRFDTKVILLNDARYEMPQTKGAEEFLIKNNIEYLNADEFDFLKFKPHIVFLQMPYDVTCRPRHLYSDYIKSLGIRIAYVSYGIEFTESTWWGYTFLNESFRAKPWKVYTISKLMKNEHTLKSVQGSDHVVVTGHPKFDGLCNNKSDFSLSYEINEKVNNRKIVFWTMHFPVYVTVTEKATPELLEYVNFAKKINKYTDLFFIVRPHPKFYEVYRQWGYEEEIKDFYNLIRNNKNSILDEESDYRTSLYNADYVIGDRSALMIETCALQVPAIYMSNINYKEKLLPSVAPIFESYYHGSTCSDIEKFINMIINNEYDYKKKEREEALKQCVPYLDGKCGERIVKDLIDSLEMENDIK